MFKVRNNQGFIKMGFLKCNSNSLTLVTAFGSLLKEVLICPPPKEDNNPDQCENFHFGTVLVMKMLKPKQTGHITQSVCEVFSLCIFAARSHL